MYHYCNNIWTIYCTSVYLSMDRCKTDLITGCMILMYITIHERISICMVVQQYEIILQTSYDSTCLTRKGQLFFNMYIHAVYFSVCITVTSLSSVCGWRHQTARWDFSK